MDQINQINPSNSCGVEKGKVWGESVGVILFGPKIASNISWQSVQQLLRYFSLHRNGGLTD